MTGGDGAQLMGARGSRLVRGEHGASSVEYGLLVTAIATVLVVIAFALGGVTTDLFSSSCNEIDGRAMTGAGC